MLLSAWMPPANIVLPTEALWTYNSALWPTLFVVVAAAADTKHILPSSIYAQKAWRAASSPFRNFMKQEDLLDPIGPPVLVSQLKVRAMIVTAGLQCFGWVGHTVYEIYETDTVHLLQAGLLAFCWLYVALKLIIMPPKTPPYLLMSFAAVQALQSLWSTSVEVGSGHYWALVLNMLAMFLPVLFTWVAGTLPMKAFIPSTNTAGRNELPSAKLTCPEDTVNFWSWNGFTFVQPILDLASVRRLDDTDVWALSPYFGHKNIFTKFLAYRTAYPNHSLLRFLISSNSLDLFLDVALELWSAIVGFVPAYSLQKILTALASDDPTAASTAYRWAFITFVANLSFAQVDLYQRWHTRRCYERTRGQMFCLLHYKSLRRQQVGGATNKDGEPGAADLGKIVNLMQGDTYAVAQRFWEFSGICTSPVRFIIALAFLYQVLGWSGLSGVGVVLVAFSLNYPLAQYDISVTRQMWKAKDARMNTVNELLQNIRFLKFYGWEYSWARKAQTARERELGWRVKRNIVDVAISFIWVWMPSATALTSFLCYTVIAGERLTVAKAFTSIALFSYLQGPMVAFPGQVFAMLHAYVSMQRIEAFLKEEEVPDWAGSLTVTPSMHDSHHRGADLGFSEASFRWPTGSTGDDTPSRFQLGPLDSRFPIGQLSIVSGATGSGKSALLAALLGELQCLSGKVLVDKSFHQVAFCAQNPWLEHATIQDNILFGTPYNAERYQVVLDACALRPDLAIFAAGDMTEIGERGITLSGGQRARVALARAMYSQAGVILLDDPLAAVDMHTAQHLVNECLGGHLARGRTIILVTHHLKVCLPIAAFVLELDKGKIHHQGTISDLEAQGRLAKIIEAEEEPFGDSVEQVADNSKSDLAMTQVKKEDVTNGVLIEEETRAEGRVSPKTYATYFRAGGVGLWVLIVASQLLIRGLNILYQVFIARWGEAYEEKLNFKHQAFNMSWNPWHRLPLPTQDVWPWLVIFLVISAFGAFALVVHLALGYYISIKASRRLFDALLQRLTRAPARFFDVTPIGRILNRFTSDINTIDDTLQNSARNCLLGVLNFLMSFGVILFLVPSFAPLALLIAGLYIRIAPPYIRTARDLRRLESVSLSPAFAGFDELLRGIVHIRAFGMENRYQDRFYQRVDKFQSFDHVYWLVNNWLGWRYDCLGSVVVYAATFFALWSGIRDGSTAVVIVQAAIFADASRQLIKVAAQLELDFNSVERVTEYLEVPQEAPAIVESCRAPAYWPSTSGDIIVEDLVVKYAEHLPPVLHSLSFVVRPSEKIGIVGRTGSGKSTLAMSLLRMVEATEGTIWLDGLDISRIGLEELRSRITIVSQDVSIFSGTIRSNLDPLGTATQEECLQAVERCHLSSLIAHDATADASALLDMRIGQDTLSAGEKQLLALARAILRRTNVILMDEATSQVDEKLDDQIQRTIREELSGAIVITIAHRLKTVMDYDRILVLDQGKIVEFDTPSRLLAKKGGSFREMCRKSADWSYFMSVMGKTSERQTEGTGSTLVG
ncbi:pleiotropic drug resistance ABC transporter [Crepidotus variabilis]|uniref:Pleiotropic drug resistance ABC transporter n=1 Tax=Crepidotus variabilis TaxID=179855 RepID=A0A9P6ELC7_9AGAR|nr:pleiotropic drug resistance ABC transporter [Crepidotus variabilis]